jgi:hypothetical protein
MKNATSAHSYYGTPVSGMRLAGVAGAKLAAPSAPYIGRNRCIANEDTCEGPKAKGTDFCVGHLRSKGQAK